MKGEERSRAIDELVSTLNYRTPPSAFIHVNPSHCMSCEDKVCLFICPAEVYVEGGEEGTVAVRWERCLECGACKYACEYIEWNYPPGGKGVVYTFG